MEKGWSVQRRREGQRTQTAVPVPGYSLGWVRGVKQKVEVEQRGWEGQGL